MKNKIAIIIILLIITISLFLIVQQTENKEKLYTEKVFIMDTVVEIKIISENDGNDIISESIKIIKDWNKRLDRYNNNSMISKINNYGESGVEVSSEMRELFFRLKEYAKLTEGNFDPTIAPLIDIWGFGEGENKIPDKNDIKSALQLINYNDIKIDKGNNKIYLPKESKIDLGAAAKGFIIDKVYEYLKENNIDNFFINAGGNIRVSGLNTLKNRKWTIGIRKPRFNNQIYNDYILEISKGAIATSGDYERYFIKNNKRYSHLLDPNTGYPARELQSVTIYSSNAMSADILSTALFIMGWENAKKEIKKSDNIAGFLIKDGEIWYSEDFEDIFTKN
ncbi:MAG TPA: FAD:protein FMN transferase [Halanaerobiales bacterium]|nr:FAD:protein FMN transferase [Halanaerobiales bacterium]